MRYTEISPIDTPRLYMATLKESDRAQIYADVAETAKKQRKGRERVLAAFMATAPPISLRTAPWTADGMVRVHGTAVEALRPDHRVISMDERVTDATQQYRAEAQLAKGAEDA